MVEISSAQETKMYKLIDTHNRTIISQHKTLEAAQAADAAHQRAVKRANGKDSYIPTCIEDENGNVAMSPEDEEAEMEMERREQERDDRRREEGSTW